MNHLLVRALLRKIVSSKYVVALAMTWSFLISNTLLGDELVPAQIEDVPNALKLTFGELRNFGPNACPLNKAQLLPTVCSDLTSIVALPGEFDDGTGKATNDGRRVKNLYEAAKLDTQNGAQGRLKAALLSGENEALMQKLIVALPKKSLCKDFRSKECLAAVLQYSGTLASSVIIGPIRPDLFDPSRPQGTVEEQAVLMDHTFLAMAKEVRNDIIKKYHYRDQEKRIESIFPKVQKLVARMLSKYVPDEKVREMLIKKVQSVKFIGTDCLGKNEWHDLNVSTLFTNNASYNKEANSVVYCNGKFINNTSEFEIVRILAHEISHSFDPCTITKDQSNFPFRYPNPKDKVQSEADYPIPGIISCLRGVNSINCKADLETGIINPNPALTKFEKPDYSPFCGTDQIREVFPDWMAAEVLPLYVEENLDGLSAMQIQTGYTNLFRSQDFSVGSTVTIHPFSGARLNRLILAQPKIREQMGCPIKPSEGLVHCPSAIH